MFRCYDVASGQNKYASDWDTHMHTTTREAEFRTMSIITNNDLKQTIRDYEYITPD